MCLLPRSTTQSAVMRQYVVCLPIRLTVCLSVTLRYDFHTGWNTTKIISWLNISHWLQQGRSGATGTPPKVGRNRVGSGAPKTCNISEMVQLREDQCDGLIVSRFRLVPKSMTLDDLERPKRHSCRNKIVIDPFRLERRYVSLNEKTKRVIF